MSRFLKETESRQDFAVDVLGLEDRQALQVATYLREARTEPGRQFAWADSRSRGRE